MRYDQKLKCLVALDGQPLTEQAAATVVRYQKQAKATMTGGERAFCRLIAPICGKHTGVHYVPQPVIYVTAGISFRLDFLFRNHFLAVEIDGGTHLSSVTKEKDQWRSAVLAEKMKLTVLRFTNYDVEHRYLWVRREVVKALLRAPKGHKRGLQKLASKWLQHPDLARQEALEQGQDA